MKQELKQQLKSRLSTLTRDQIENALVECIEEMIIYETLSYHPEWAGESEEDDIDYTLPYWHHSGEPLIPEV